MSTVATIAVVIAIFMGADIVQKAIRKGNCIMSEALDRLRREVAETKTATASAVALIKGLSEQIRGRYYISRTHRTRKTSKAGVNRYGRGGDGRTIGPSLS